MFIYYKIDLAEIIETYLDRDIFAKVLPINVDAGYVINSTDRVEIEDKGIRISGRAYRWPVTK